MDHWAEIEIGILPCLPQTMLKFRKSSFIWAMRPRGGGGGILPTTRKIDLPPPPMPPYCFAPKMVIL